MINVGQNEMLNELAPTVYWPFIVGPPPPNLFIGGDF